MQKKILVPTLCLSLSVLEATALSLVDTAPVLVAPPPVLVAGVNPNAPTVTPNQAFDNLIDSSANIRDQLSQGILSVYGARAGAHAGQATGELQGHIDLSTVRLYNESLQNVEGATFYNAEQFLEDQYQAQMQIMEEAVDVFTAAATEIAVAVEVNEIASNATTDEQKQEVAQVIENNDFTIQEQDVVAYNDSIDTIEDSASTAAVILTAQADEMFTAMLDDFTEANGVMMGDANIEWDAISQQGTMTWDVMVNGQLTQIGGPLEPMMFGQSVLTTEQMLTMGQAELQYECDTGVIPGYEFLCQ